MEPSHALSDFPPACTCTVPDVTKKPKGVDCLMNVRCLLYDKVLIMQLQIIFQRRVVSKFTRVVFQNRRSYIIGLNKPKSP